VRSETGMPEVVAPRAARVKPVRDAAQDGTAMVGEMFEKVLILRRGEAATRVARTCRRLGVESIVVAPKDEPASRHIEAADRAIEVDFAEADGIPTELLPSILEQASADAAHVGYQGQPGMFELASAAEKADVAVVGTDPSSGRVKSPSWSLPMRTGRPPPSQSVTAASRWMDTR
jgi:NADPH-dependent glutamate synthase beta subunit-like oxidoreductase